jgi:hypothetical protein
MNTAAIEMLKKIGVEAISMRTHISTDNVHKLLAGEFESFSAIQFNGFVTIIEREFDVDLTAWRDEFSQRMPEVEEPLEPVEDDPFANAAKSKKQQRMTVAVLTALLILVVMVTYLVLGGGDKAEKIELNNTAIEQARANLASMNTTTVSQTQAQMDSIQETHQREAVESVEAVGATEADEGPASVEKAEANAVVKTVEPAAPKETNLTVETPSKSEVLVSEDVVLRPTTTIWLGVIDAETSKRTAQTTDDPLHLDGSKTWLIVTGHGFFSLECGGEKTRFSQRERVYLLYEAGKCLVLDEAEFKARNRGRVW